MRFTSRAALVVACVAAIGVACGGDGGGGGSGLFGTWVASPQDAGTEFVLDNNAGTTIDAVADYGGVATLAVNANGAYSLTVTVSGLVAFSSSGTYVADTSAHTITITETGGSVIPLDYILAANTLSIATQNLGDITFDFDGNPGTPDEPAHLYATFARH